MASDVEKRQLAELQDRCRDLEERLKLSEERLRDRSGLLYELQRQYASEHFDLQESMRNLKIERLRNAGAFADREILLQRARELQLRISSLKGRLSKHEPVEDLLFDDAPIVADP